MIVFEAASRMRTLPGVNNLLESASCSSTFKSYTGAQNGPVLLKQRRFNSDNCLRTFAVSARAPSVRP